jgi:hypothetical protein
VTKKELLALIEAQRERIDALEQRLAEVEARPIVPYIIAPEPMTPKPELPDDFKPWGPWVYPYRYGDSTADGGVLCDEPTARLLSWLERRAE